MRRHKASIVVSLGALAAALALVPFGRAASAGGGCHAAFEEGQTEGKGTTVELVGNCIGPTVLRVGPGAEVTFVNRDQVVHRIDGVGWYADRDLRFGEFMTRRFDAPGTYPFSCHLHPGMNGAVVVGGGLGSGRVVEVTPVSALVSAPSAAPGPPDGDGGIPTAVAVLAVTGAGGAAYLAGRRRRA